MPLNATDVMNRRRSKGSITVESAFSPQKMEPTTGIEPVNLFLTKEVLYLLSYVG